MTKFLLILVIIIILFSCSQTKKYRTEDIIGDWYSAPIQNDNGIHDYSTLTFSFEDNVCSCSFTYNNFVNYKIVNDELILDAKLEDKSNTRTSKYKIIKLTKDSLFLAIIDNKTLYITKYLNNLKVDTLKLAKVMKKNAIKFDRIGFYSSGCFGDCPVMFLEIDSVRNILFNGISFTQNIGIFTGKLSEEDMSIILKKINALSLGNLKPFYKVNWTDDQTLSVVIRDGNNIIVSGAYGSKDEPIELRLLFNKLKEVYKNVNLTKEDSSVLNKFQLRTFHIGILPLPPLPPIKNNKFTK